MQPPAHALALALQPGTLTGDMLPAEIDRSSSTLEHEGDRRDQLQTLEADLQRVRA